MNVEHGFERGGYASGQHGSQCVAKGSGGSGQHGSHNIVEGGSVGSSRGVKYCRDDRPINPIRTNGRYLTCKACGLFRHMVTDCSDSRENIYKTNILQKDGLCKQEEYDINVVKEGETVTLFAGNNKRIIEELGNCAVLDCGCSSTVCGQKWMDCHLQSLGPDDKSRVVCSPGRKVFKFGGDERFRSLANYSILAVLAGKDVRIQTDIVDSDIPLLLSLESMNKAKVKLDLERDSAEILERRCCLMILHLGIIVCQ